MLDVGIVQLDVVDAAVARNLEKATQLISASSGADLYLLPELWTSGYAHAQWPAIAEEETPGVVDALAALAARMSAAIAGSMIARNEAGQLVNRMYWIERGRVVHYDKAHLFPPMLEPEHLVAGSVRCEFESHGTRVALSICFDLRFPMMYRCAALDGAEVFVVSSEWPAERASALRALCVARALENQAYLVLCNRTGTAADGTEFSGGSGLFGPRGEVIAELDHREGILRLRLDVEDVRDYRRGFSVFSHENAAIDGAPGATVTG